MTVLSETEMFPVKRSYVRGRKPTCARPGCDEPHVKSHRYCREHKNAASRVWQRERAEELKFLRANATKGETADEHGV